MKIENTMENQIVSIHLSTDEALVLFDWLVRFNEAGNSDSFEDQSERRVLFDLETVIEKQIVATFQDNYKILLFKARDTVKDK
ncbi:MAG: hypothetical protein HUM72_24915 [Dolichospermum sp.]|nr:hypothetical protein [Dolichospermum sp.]